MAGGVGRSGLPIPRSVYSSPRRRASAFSRSSSAKTYGGSAASGRLNRPTSWEIGMLALTVTARLGSMGLWRRHVAKAARRVYAISGRARPNDDRPGQTVLFIIARGSTALL